MKGQFLGPVVTQTVSVAISQGKAVSLAGALPSAAAAILGVALVDLNSGENGGVCISGIVYALGGGVTAVGDALKVDAAGKFIAQGGSGVIVGYALEAGADNKLFRIKLI